MNLYLISQDVNNDYDTYDSAVVATETEEAAKNIHPSPYFQDGQEWETKYGCWAYNPSQVKVQLIGRAEDSVKAGVVLASFNAG